MQPTVTANAPKWYEKTWLVVLLIFICFPVGLYGLWKSQSISKGWKWGVTVGYVLLLFAALSAPSPPAETTLAAAANEPTDKEIEEAVAATSGENSKTVSETKEKSTKALFSSADDFKTAFNRFTTSNDLDFSIDELTIKEGEVANSFNYQLTDHLGLVGSVEKATGSVTSIIMIGSGDGTFKSGSNIILGMCSIIAAVDPSIPSNKRIDVLKGLGLMGDKNVDYTDMPQKEFTKNGIKYTVTASSSIGLWFSASPVEG